MRDNKLCSCGSGRSYELCCGAMFAEEDHNIQASHLSAYASSIGRQREEYCLSYIKHKRNALAEITEGLSREALASGKTIYCHKGCNVCCHVYVVASLQECEAIVYYLYRHEDALRHFIDAFRSWRKRINTFRDAFFEVGRLQQKRLSSTDTAEDNDAFNAALLKYTRQSIPCPFLKDGACIVYEVRPYACVGLVSTTPPSWCASSHPSHKKIVLLKAEVKLDDDLPYFANPSSEVSLTNMPALVYEILCYGWEFLGRVPGCTHLLSDKP